MLITNIWKHGKMFYLRFGKLVRWIILDPLVAQQILVQNADCYGKASFITALRILGNGIFTASGTEWMLQRQLLAHCFFAKELKGHFEIIKSSAKDAVNSWAVLDTEIVDVHKCFLTLTVQLICLIVFGERIEDRDAATLARDFDTYLHEYKRLFFNPFLSFIGYSWKTRQIAKQEEKLMAAVRGLVNRRKERGSSKKGLVAVDAMIDKARENKDFSDMHVLDNSVTFLLAGHETTASLLTWTVYLLATNMNWQARARAEAQGIEELDAKNVSQLKTLGNILWESLRLFPPQPLIGRWCTHENTAQGVKIPEEMEIIFAVAALHRDKAIWGDNSDEFKPDRFARGINKACGNPASFLPFGSGPHTCIGQTLALLEAKVILYFMLKSYSWELSPNYQHRPDVTLTLQPMFGMPIILVRL